MDGTKGGHDGKRLRGNLDSLLHMGCPARVIHPREHFAAYLMFEGMGNPMGERFYSLPGWWQEAIRICRDEWATIVEGRAKAERQEREQADALKGKRPGGRRGSIG